MTTNLKHERTFHKELLEELNKFNEEQANKYPKDEFLTIDLHCHNYNSDVPDELLGRILKVPETWLPTKSLLKTLKKHGSTAFTITNHNNARSIWEQREKGKDILSAAEFSCMVPDFNIGIHVLTYGFTPKQEKILNKLRRNVYAFQEYTCKENIPTIWAHPLYYYAVDGVPPFEFFDKMALIFERFEVLNGQRDTWQNMLVKIWVESLTPEKIDELAQKTGIDPKRYCRNPYLKAMSGGSDSHMGIFAGLTGTRLHVPDLQNRIFTTSLSDLALEAIREGRMAPFGSHNNNEKMTVAFLDYVCQIALYYKDPGIIRMLLHKGSMQDKIIALMVSNGFAELKRHKVTMNFIELFHKSFGGKAPHFSKRWFIPKVYKPIFDDATKIAKIKKNSPENIIDTFTDAVYSISEKLNNILADRLVKKIDKLSKNKNWDDFNLATFIDKMELPSEFRSLINPEKKSLNGGISFNFGDFMDGLSFPFLTSSLILLANFTSARVLYNARPLLTEFSAKIDRLKHPKRMLWLTDTYEDHNGVSMVLKSFHQEIKARNLPIDIMVCSKTLQADDNLIVVDPLMEFKVPFYRQQTFRVPRLLDIQKIFLDGEYDRIICSTEGPMGMVALFLKNAYFVPTHFYIHTDWLMFGRKVLKMDRDNLSRMRRFLRAFYQSFDNLFVLNSDHQKWLSSEEMGFDPEKVKLTAHWAESEFYPRKSIKQIAFGVEEKSPVVLFAGRLSHEKGIMELPKMYKNLVNEIPDIQFVIAGSGPAEEALKAEFPEAVYMGWVNHDELPNLYSAADILVLPSKFDTFSCVVLESLSCGLPVIAYKTKGPKDIIIDGENGYLVSNQKTMVEKLGTYLKEKQLQENFKQEAVNRGKYYNPDKIIEQFIQDTGLKDQKE